MSEDDKDQANKPAPKPRTRKASAPKTTTAKAPAKRRTPAKKAASPAKKTTARNTTASAAKTATKKPTAKRAAPAKPKAAPKPEPDAAPKPKVEAKTTGKTDKSSLDAAEIVLFAVSMLFYLCTGLIGLTALLILRFFEVTVLRGQASIAAISGQIEAYLSQILAYSSDPDKPAPFPFSAWPDGKP